MSNSLEHNKKDQFKNLDWHDTLEKIKNYSTSSTAKDLIAKTAPFKTKEESQKQVNEIYQAKAVVSLDFRPRLDSLDLFFSWFERLKRKAVLKTSEFQEVRRFCFDIFNLQKTLSQTTNDWTTSSLAQLMDTTKIHSAIDQIITFEGDIRVDASETLHNLYNEKKNLERQIRTTLDKFVKTHEMETLLQDRYVTNREGRWVLPIRSGKQRQFDGIIHDSSQTKQTVFMEPKEIIAINNRLKEAESEIEAEIEKLLTQLTHFVAGSCNELLRAYHKMLECDQRLAQAQFALKTNSSTFEFTDNEFFLKEVRHPLLSFQNIKEVISNNVEFDDGKKVLILSGPNAGGKTVLLKAIGLTCHMARCGLLVPAAEESKIPFFKTIFVAIGDTQSVDEHMSTFAAHLNTLSKALTAKGKDNLILVDEICGSTDPEEGAAIAKSFIEHYAENDVFGVITSHLGPLKQIWPKESPITCGSMEFTDHPTYKLFMGIHGRSFALKTAKAAGVPESIIQKAMSYLSTETRVREEKLNELDQYKEKVVELSRKLELETRMMETEKNKYKDVLKKFESEKNHHISKAVDRAEKKIEKIIEEFRANPNVSKVKAQFPEIVKSTGSTPSVTSVEEFSRQFPPGSTAYLSNLGQDGIIQGLPNSKGEVTVLSKSMRLQIHWKDVRAANAPNIQHPVQQQKKSKIKLPQDEIEIDIRGMSTDQAIEELEKSFDKALQEQVDRVKIIHGHGTEALKKSVRKYLSRSVYIQKWQAGSESSNDDGYTWADLS
ncbi:MAG: Smr/MutS family protein [Bdellovibrionota bacterium]